MLRFYRLASMLCLCPNGVVPDPVETQNLASLHQSCMARQWRHKILRLYTNHAWPASGDAKSCVSTPITLGPPVETQNLASLHQSCLARQQFLHHALFERARFGQSLLQRSDLRIYIPKHGGNGGLFVYRRQTDRIIPDGLLGNAKERRT